MDGWMYYKFFSRLSYCCVDDFKTFFLRSCAVRHVLYVENSLPLINEYGKTSAREGVLQ